MYGCTPHRASKAGCYGGSCRAYSSCYMRDMHVQVLADCLSAQARRLLFAREAAPAPDPTTAKSTEPAAAEPAAFVDTNTHAIAAVLEAGLHAVPAEILQECVLLGPGSRRAAAWSRHMLCDLVTDKVSRALAHLYDAGRQAQEKQPVRRCLGQEPRTLRPITSARLRQKALP